MKAVVVLVDAHATEQVGRIPRRLDLTPDIDLTNALRRLKRQMDNGGVFGAIKRHDFYVKPGARRRAKSARVRKKKARAIRRSQAVA